MTLKNVAESFGHVAPFSPESSFGFYFKGIQSTEEHSQININTGKVNRMQIAKNECTAVHSYVTLLSSYCF